MKKLKHFLTRLATLALVLALLPFSVANAQDTNVWVDAPTEVAQGSDFTATIRIDDVVDLDSYQFKLHYNPAVIEVIGAEGGTEGVTDGEVGGTSVPVAMWMFSPPVNPGTIFILGNVSGIIGATGSGYLCEIHFHVIGEPDDVSNLDFDATERKLFDTSGTGTQIPATWVGDSVHVPGSFNVVCDASPNPAKVDQPVDFTCTPIGGVPGYTYSWDFGDGVGTSNLQNPTYTYTDDITYHACVTVYDSLQSSAECCVDVTVYPTLMVCRHLPATVQRESTFDVSVTWSAPDDNFNSILLTDFAPVGWTVQVNTTWCTPAALAALAIDNKAEITWPGPYTDGTAFTVLYKVTVPGDAELGIHTFPNGTLRYYISGVGPSFDNIVCDDQVEVAEGAIIRGITGEVRCDMLTGVTIELYKGGVFKNSTTSDDGGNYEITATETGDYNVIASKNGFRDKTQAITIPNLTQEYTLDFRGEHGLIPNAPDAAYAMDCVNRWLYPPSPECALSAGTAMDVVNAWLYPV